MKNSSLRLPLIGACVLTAASLGMTTQAPARNDTGAVVAGVIVGAAIGAAVSSNIKHKNNIYVAGPPPSRQGFSPKHGVWCYPAQRACYNKNGAYAPNWTYKVFAR